MNPIGWEVLKRRWYCADCGRIYKRPYQYAEDGTAWHSWKCRTPMTLVDVEITALTTTPPAPESATEASACVEGEAL